MTPVEMFTDEKMFKSVICVTTSPARRLLSRLSWKLERQATKSNTALRFCSIINNRSAYKYREGKTKKKTGHHFLTSTLCTLGLPTFCCNKNDPSYRNLISTNEVGKNTTAAAFTHVDDEA